MNKKALCCLQLNFHLLILFPQKKKNPNPKNKQHNNSTSSSEKAKHFALKRLILYIGGKQ